MKEVGIDISNQKSKEITEEMMRNSEKIVNMGCMDNSFCPTLFIPHVIDWGIEDPKGKLIEKVREIRDEIDGRVRQLAAELNKDNMQANL
jgi:arsenate reductase (thioredoxin)